MARESQQPEAPTYEHLGERVGQILALAEAEAAEIRDRVRGEVETVRKEAEQEVGALRADAERYAEETRRDADADGARILADARKAADGERDAAERDASARRAEAEALYEDQRAKAAQAAADFETTLAERRQKATAEFQAQQAAIQAELDAMAARNKDTEATLERNRREAEERIARMLADAEERSTTMVAEARATAGRVRAESERELAAAGQRRDSINAQLSNVRQMLATLSGTVPGVVGLSEERAPVAGAPQGDPSPRPPATSTSPSREARRRPRATRSRSRTTYPTPKPLTSGEPGGFWCSETRLTHRSYDDTLRRGPERCVRRVLVLGNPPHAPLERRAGIRRSAAPGPPPSPARRPAAR